MKIALVHELLTMRGGAERVLRVLADMFPDAPIYTLLYNEKKLGDWFPKERMRVSHLQTTNYQLPTSLLNHHLYLRKFPSAVEAWDFSDFDLVISSSSAFAHGIITNGKPKHLSYVHSPARYLWDRTHDVLERASKGPLGLLKRRHLEKTFHPLRTWDAEVAPRADILLTPSKEVQRRIELYWRRESEVLHPPIDDFWLTELASSGQRVVGSEKKYLIVSTLVPYKRIDLVIEACNLLKRSLTIVGEGPGRKALQRKAGPTVKFLGYKDQAELRHLYSEATATLFPGEEDFGLVPLESMACGTPVIGFRKGGALETIIEGKTGEFFDEPTAESLAKAMQRLEQKTYDNQQLRAQAEKFSRKEFEQGLQKHIEALM